VACAFSHLVVGVGDDGVLVAAASPAAAMIASMQATASDTNPRTLAGAIPILLGGLYAGLETAQNVELGC